MRLIRRVQYCLAFCVLLACGSDRGGLSTTQQSTAATPPDSHATVILDSLSVLASPIDHDNAVIPSQETDKPESNVLSQVSSSDVKDDPKDEPALVPAEEPEDILAKAEKDRALDSSGTQSRRDTLSGEPFQEDIATSGEKPMPNQDTLEQDAGLAKSNPDEPDPDDSWNEMLQKYVDPSGLVDYKSWKAEESRLQDYLQSLSEASEGMDTESREVQLAYWINSYNAHTVALILKHYPLSSIMEISDGKAWDIKWIKAEGVTLSLNDIEHKIIRQRWKEPRIHFAVNCAARSCPPLLNEAFQAVNLESQLERQTRRFILSSYNDISPERLRLSRIFEWYGEDFGDVLVYVARYTRVPVRDDAKIEFMEYDWRLNQ